MVAIKETTERKTAPQESLEQDSNNQEAIDLLEKTISLLKRRLSFFVWQGFFEPIKALSLINDQLTLQAPSSFHKNWVMDHYLPELIAAASESYGKTIKVIINSSADSNKKERLTLKSEIKTKKITKPEIE